MIYLIIHDGSVTQKDLGNLGNVVTVTNTALFICTMQYNEHDICEHLAEVYSGKLIVSKIAFPLHSNLDDEITNWLKERERFF